MTVETGRAKYLLKIAAAGAILCAGNVWAASPNFQRVNPPGAQRGAEVEVVLEGQRLADIEEALFYQPGITVQKIAPENNNRVKATFKVADDARLGEYALRLRAKTGISELRTFYVGALPVIADKEPNTIFTEPQKIDLNCTVSGTITSEDVDYFQIDVKKGQRINIEVEGMRLGQAMFDPYIAVLDGNRFELAASDDSALLLQDPIVSFMPPADATYTIQLRDSVYGGAGNAFYRMHVGTFPRPLAVYPPGGQAGQELTATFIADLAGAMEKPMKLPYEVQDRWPIWVEKDGQVAPSPNYMRVSKFESVNEAEPNDEVRTATKKEGEAPVAFNGVLQADKDVDVFKFTAKKGQQLDVWVYGRKLRSPVDAVLTITNEKGGGVANNDDNANFPDSYVRFNPPADGEYCIHVRDHLRRGGPAYVYRVEVTPVEPSIIVSIPEVNQNNNAAQERQTVPVPRGNRYATLMRTARRDIGGDMVLDFKDLPEGITVHAEPVPGNVDTIPVVFEAAEEAEVAGKLVDVVAKPTDAKSLVRGSFQQTVDLVQGPNNSAYYQTNVEKLAVAVIEPAPFKLDLMAPKSALVQNGSMNLKVKAERREGFKGAISVRLLYNPPGVSSSLNASIPEGKDEVEIPVQASGGAQVKSWKTAVIGSADVQGPLWVSSALTPLEIAPPIGSLQIEATVVEQGKSGEMVCTVEYKEKFGGKAKAQLKGLPGNVTSPEIEVTADQQTLTFKLDTTNKAPIGRHKAVFCQLTFERNGETIVQNLGSGGVIRIVPPQKTEEKKPEEKK